MADGRPPAFVLSLLLSDADSLDEVVVGVRRPTAQSDRHPGVLSTPTQRLPAALFAACQPHWPAPGPQEPVVEPVDDPGVTPLGGPGTSAAPLGFAVETLLCRKLGLTEPLASGRLRGTAAAVAVAAGQVEDPKGPGEAEATVMLTVRAILAGLRACLPDGTPFLDPVLFAPAEAFVRAVQQNDALLVEPTLDPFEICIGGLCVTSGALVLGRSPTG
jgi:hypothetical protein